MIDEQIESDKELDKDNDEDDEVLLQTGKFVEGGNEITSITLAPGENKIPVPSYAIENIDKFCFCSKASTNQILQNAYVVAKYT